MSWQLMLTNLEGEERPAIVPSLLFVGEKCGMTEEVIHFYLSVFKNAKQATLKAWNLIKKEPS
nr:hypothetical protein [Bacillus sp. OV322]